METGETITLLKNVTDGSGIGIFETKDGFAIKNTTADVGSPVANNITIDFGGYTYAVKSPAVGSTNTETQAFHIEKGFILTLKNGTLTSADDADSKVLMLFQNYCNLTLEDMTLDGTKINNGYTLSNNNGTVVIDNTTISAPQGKVAIDLYAMGSYDGPSVSIKGNSHIDGTIEYGLISSSAGADAKYNLSLTIESGKIKDITFPKSMDSKITSNVVISGGEFESTLNTKYINTIDVVKSLKANIVFAENGDYITLQKGAAFDGTISYTDDKGVLSSVVFPGVKASAESTITAGPVEISGSFTTDSSGNIIVTGDAVITGDSTLGSGLTLTVNNGATLTVNNGATLTVEGTVNTAGNGKVAGTGKVVVQNGDISGANVSGVTIEDESDDSAKKTITWKDGEIDYYADGSAHTIGSNQIINIEGKVILVSGSELSIAGKLVIPEGAELVVESDAKLTFVTGGILVVEGTLTIEAADEDVVGSRSGIVAFNSAIADISGNLAVNGDLTISGASIVTFKQDSSALVAATGILNVTGGKAVIDASAVLTINGIATGAIQNKGTVVIDSSVKATGALTISNVADGAVVDVVKFTGTAILTVNDNGLVYTTYRDSVAKKDVNVTDDAKNTVVTITPSITGAGSDKYVASVSGLKVVSVTSSKNADAGAADNPTAGIAKGKQWSKSMDIAGSVATSYALNENEEAAEGDQPKASATIVTTATSKGFTVTGELALGDNVTLNNCVEVSVTGTVSAVKSASIDNRGKITVTGEGEVSKVEGTVVKTVSTLYTTSVKDSTGAEIKTNHYVNIDKALVVVNTEGSAVKTLTLQDKQTVKTSASLPEGVTLDLNGKVLTIDSKDNVTLEIVKGATVKSTVSSGAKIVVGGTLYAQDKTNVSKVSTIESDVYTEEIGEDGKAVKNGWAKWTNLTSALEDAKSGDKIVLHDDVDLDSNTTVPEGVTLDAGDYKIKLADGVTLTVNGTLTTDADILAQSAFATEAKKNSVERAYSSAIIVNGKLVSSTEFKYGYSEPATFSSTGEAAYSAKLTVKGVIAGAYYTDKDNHVISSLQIAQNEFADIVGDVITVNGAVTAGDLSFTATEDCTGIVIGAAATDTDPTKKIETVLAVSSLTLSGMDLTVSGKITGSVAVGDAAVDMKKVEGISITSDDSKLAFTGTAVKGTLTVSKGTVYGNATIANDAETVFTAASGATLEIAGTVTVNNLAIDGIVNVPSGKTLDVKKQADVTGAVTVAPATDSKAAGTFNVAGELFMGISSDDITTGAAASFSGPVTVSAGKKILVAADASVDDAFKASVKNLKNTEFYVQGSLWFTAYANGEDVKIKVSKIPVENVDLVGWSETEGGKEVSTTTDFTYTIGSSSKLYALIETQVYKIVIKADEGIDNVYLDGQLMTYGMISDSDSDNYAIFYAYTATVAAGDHKVTYTLKNGYSGEATLYSDGTAVAGNTINATGSFDDDLVFTLSGVEKSGYVDPTPVTPSEDKDDGLTVTDYLLIVLVVLIVIMAVIVAMRLMRS